MDGDPGVIVTYYPLLQLAAFMSAWAAGILTMLLVSQVAK